MIRLGFAVTALIPLCSLQVAPPSDAFVLVRGTHYEGAIIPASSSWHRSLWTDPAIRNELKVANVWTPSEPQVAAAESALQAFVDAALKESASTSATSQFKQVLVRGDIRALAQNLTTLKRQYGGIAVGAERMILVHGFPEDAARRWHTEAIMTLGQACRQFWMDFNVPKQRVTRLRCGSVD
jgi:hypothetical protein